MRAYITLILILTQGIALQATKPLSKEVQDALFEHIQDEFYAEIYYKKVISKYSSSTVFIKVYQLNQDRLQNLYELYRKYKLDVPEVIWQSSSVETPYAYEKLCFTAFGFETDKRDALENYLKLELPKDIRMYFEVNLIETKETVLPLMVECRKN